MRDYSYRLGKYGISHERERELIWFCRQYDQYRAQMRAERLGDTPRRGGNAAWHPKDPTGNTALRLAGSWAATRVKLIEDCAKASDKALWRHLVRNVCQHVPYERLNVPIGRGQFYQLRVLMLLELDRRLR